MPNEQNIAKTRRTRLLFILHRVQRTTRAPSEGELSFGGLGPHPCRAAAPASLVSGDVPGAAEKSEALQLWQSTISSVSNSRSSACIRQSGSLQLAQSLCRCRLQLRQEQDDSAAESSSAWAVCRVRMSPDKADNRLQSARDLQRAAPFGKVLLAICARPVLRGVT